MMLNRKFTLEGWLRWLIRKDLSHYHKFCFKLLYGLPTTLQLELCSFVASRYLPIFEQRNPQLTWPRLFLTDLPGWWEQQGETLPDVHGLTHYPDDTFYSAWQFLETALEELKYGEPGLFTWYCVDTITQCIDARSCNAWAADDPLAVQAGIDGKMIHFNEELNTVSEPYDVADETIQQARRRFSGPHSNAAALAVQQREWEEVVFWFFRKQVWEYPVNVELVEVSRLWESFVEQGR